MTRPSRKLRGDWSPIPNDFLRRLRGLTPAAKVAFLALTLHSNRELLDWELDVDDQQLAAADSALGHTAWPKALDELRRAAIIEGDEQRLRLSWRIGLSREERERQSGQVRERVHRFRLARRRPGNQPGTGPDPLSRVTPPQADDPVTRYEEASPTRADEPTASPGADVTRYTPTSPGRGNALRNASASLSEEGDSSNVYVSQTARAHAREAANGGLDTELVDSQHGDRVLFEAQLFLAERGPHTVDQLVRLAMVKTGRGEDYVRGVLGKQKRRFVRLTDGRLDLSAEALR